MEMLSLSEKKKIFLDKLQKKYRKKKFAFLAKGVNETITMDGKEINLAWSPHLDQLNDTHNELADVLFNDCIEAIKESIKAERKKNRANKKVYINKSKKIA